MQINKILIGVDESKFSEYAAAYGFDIARTFSAHVGLVHIIEPNVAPINSTDTITGMPMQTSGIDDMEMLNIQEDMSENIIERTIKKYAGNLQVTHFNEYGSTADSIISCSKEFGADLIIIGTHNRSGIDRLLMGSVAESVVRNSHIPVLVVPLLADN
ncbi:universal stress protein [Mucilaginibacter segetis]|uniref:Universal stress protein n=1 Tax=Mucilaginibacter segetis TaxID=2793071 RepID=A0A934PRR3_9SPHI|nr:universal stress protein [Mucilaginibacter segetis]MBK0378026.1 universal stress protein [Mucilaginibacter segetis]